MSIRLTSPPRLAFHERPSKSSRIATLFCFSTPAGRLLISTLVALLLSILYLRHVLWNEPRSAFFNGADAYEYRYTQYRLSQAREYISAANTTHMASAKPAISHNQPVICAAMMTIKRKQIQYVSDSVGSMLEGLTAEERSAINVRLLFANIDAEIHPNWNDTWLNAIDWWGPYNITEEEREMLRDYRAKERINSKGIFDYTYMLEQCYNETSAPFIAMFEDDIVLADGWAAKTLEALSTIREATDPWLYFRLFFTESQLSWDKDVDVWYTNPIFQLIVPIALSLAIAAGVKIRCSRQHRTAGHHLSCSACYILFCVTIPAFIALLFVSGYHSMTPESGIVKMNTKGCCTQALVYPREQVPALLHHMRTTKPYPHDLLIEDYASEIGLDRYAIAPQLVQHVGLISTRGMPKKYTQQTWASHFEDLDPEALRREHAELARWGIWRAELGDGA